MKTVYLAAILLVARAGAGAEADRGTELHVVLARTDGTHAAATLPLGDKDVAAAKHFWAWTGQLPPRKLDPRKAASSDELIQELGSAPIRSLDVHVRGWSRPEELASLRVVVAPVEMWASVPETLLPNFPLSREGRASVVIRDPSRLRVVGPGFGTVWESIASPSRSVDVLLRRPGVEARPVFRASDGGPAGQVFAMVLSRRRGDAVATRQAQFASDAKGSLQIPSLPEAEVLTLYVSSERSAPHTISGTAAELSRSIRLPAAAEVRGRFVDEKGHALTEVAVEAEGWSSADAPVAVRSEARSNEAGRWVVRGLPRATVMLRAAAPGRSTLRKRIALEDGDVDLGTMSLPRAREVLLTVTDASQDPVLGAEIVSDSGFAGRTGEQGKVSIKNLPADEGSTLTLSAEGFAKRTFQLAPPYPAEERVTLERSFSISGRVLDDAGAPVTDANIVVAMGSRYRNETVEADGEFSIDVDVGEDFQLTFESPSAAAVVRKEEAGRAGERRALGEIILSSGASARGRVTDNAGAPVRGARIWAVRPSAGGVVAAWVGGRFVQTVSDSDGSFDLRGLATGPAVLRIDATDFARAYRDVVMSDEPLGLDDIELVRGYSVIVTGAASGVAQLDLRGQSLDADIIAAPVVDGQARLRNVPPGRYAVKVVEGQAVLCERRVDVRSGADASVSCPPPMTVRGRVVIGGTPAFAGTLTWSRPGQTDTLIDNRVSGLGARQQRVYGVTGGMVVVPVQPDGTFVSEELRAGEWQVGWRSTDSAGTPQRTFAIPDVADAHVVVEFTGGVIRGRVLDEQARPAAGARIREIGGSLYAMTADDGSFTMTAVQPGIHRIQAAVGAKTTRVIEIEVEEGKPAPEVVLQLGQEDDDVVTVTALGIDGRPKPGAFVFVETRGGAIRTLTADENGVAAVRIAEGLPDVARVVAYADRQWAFGLVQRDRKDPNGGPETAVVRFTRTGSMRIESTSFSGAPALLSPRVPGDLAWMVGRTGAFLELVPGGHLLIEGLPAGHYELRMGEERVAVAVTPGELVVVRLR